MHEPYRALAGCDAEEDLTIGATAVTLTVPCEADRAVCVCRDANVVYTINGVTPTATDLSTGHQMVANTTVLYLYGTEMSTVQFIRATSTSAKLHVRYERRLI